MESRVVLFKVNTVFALIFEHSKFQFKWPTLGGIDRWTFISWAAVFITFLHWGLLTTLVFLPTLLAPHTHPELYLNILSPANVSVHIRLTRFSLNIKANNDDVLVFGSLFREFGKIVVSFIMSRVCCCCSAIVKIVSASGQCIKKKQRSRLSTGLIYF